MSIEFIAEEYFDFEAKKFYLNDEPIVLHCHFYSTLLTQLAKDTIKFNGPEIMACASEEIFFSIFDKYFKKHNIMPTEDRISIIEQYYSYVGLGLMKIDIDNYTVELIHSHLDEAWLKKWPTPEMPLNFITQGIIAAAFSAVTNTNIGIFNVQEIQSIACGAETSKFIIKEKSEK